MGNVGGKLLFSLKGALDLGKKLIKSIRKLVNLILSFSKFYPAGQILVTLNLTHGFSDPADRPKGPSRKQIADHGRQYNQKGKNNDSEPQSNPKTGLRIRDRRNAPDKYKTVAVQPIGKIIDIPLFFGVGQGLDLPIGKIRMQGKSIRYPAK